MSLQDVTHLASGPAVVPLAPHRFTVEQYHEMIASGILTENDRVQLLDGVIAEMSPVGLPHRNAVQVLMRWIMKNLPDGWDLQIQQPITVGASEPEPDLAVVRMRDYRDRHPGPADIALLIEIADSSIETDRITKGEIYAAAGIREYWIVNLVDRCVEIHRDPVAAGSAKATYPACEIVPATGKLTLKLDGVALGDVDVASVIA
jgi:Uma2 family endonuclease